MESESGQVLTLLECSAYLKVAESSLYVLAREGRVPCQKVGRHWRFSKSALDKWLQGVDIASLDKKPQKKRS
jgi:excisionase family DNA binding protein